MHEAPRDLDQCLSSLSAEMNKGVKVTLFSSNFNISSYSLGVNRKWEIYVCLYDKINSCIRWE